MMAPPSRDPNTCESVVRTENAPSASSGSPEEVAQQSAIGLGTQKKPPQAIDGANKDRDGFHCWCRPVTMHWAFSMDTIRDHISHAVLVIAYHAASHPWSCIAASILLSCASAGIGYATNFTYTAEPDVGMTPTHSVINEQKRWIEQESKFPPHPHSLRLLIHNQGDTVVTKQGVAMTFDIVNEVQTMDQYVTFCAASKAQNEFGYGGTCHIRGVPLFWNLTEALFEESVQTDWDVLEAVSAKQFPDNSTVDPRELMGRTKVYHDSIISAQSFLMEIAIPATLPDESLVLAEALLGKMLQLRDEWANNPTTTFRLEVYLNDYSLEMETIAAVFKDLPLIPSVFVLMTIFTCLVFSLSHKPGSKVCVQRVMLGVGAVITILLSMVTSYGFLFMIGIPFTSLAQILPFVMFGIGLDDSFIIFGEYTRSDDKKKPVERIKDTFEEIGLSIFLTSLTTAVAFGFGSMTTLPGVAWLSMYAFVCVAVDFLYQITFFVALLVIDERRIERQRALGNAGCMWLSCSKQKPDTVDLSNEKTATEKSGNGDSFLLLEKEERKQDEVSTDTRDRQIMLQTGDTSTGMMKAPSKEEEKEEENEEEEEKEEAAEKIRASSFELLEDDYAHHYHHHLPGPPASSMDRFMKWYAKILLRPPVKIGVLLLFVAATGILAYSASKFRQKFDIYEVLSADSYTGDFFKAVESYADRGFVVPHAYFRNVDQSDPDIQQQMDAYVNDLVSIDAFSSQPPFFWLRHFKEFLTYDDRLLYLTFNTQLDIFLSIDVFRLLYGDHIVRDPESGNITASRCVMYMDQIDFASVQNQVNIFNDQLNVTESQPINSIQYLATGQTSNFFLYESSMIYAWEFFDQLVQGLISSSILGMITVTLISFLFLPHWTGALILAPLMAVLYIDLLGFLRFCGVYLNAINFFTMMMSIGLLVDFNMHILLKYYESPCATREMKVKDALQTMGSSVIVGGLSTFLGVVPLLFSTSQIMTSLFYGFWGMVVIGLSHGVILLPVLLSYIGPVRTTAVTVTHMTEDGLPALVETKDSSERSDVKTCPSSICGSPTSMSGSRTSRQDSDGDRLEQAPPNQQFAALEPIDTLQHYEETEVLEDQKNNPTSTPKGESAVLGLAAPITPPNLGDKCFVGCIEV